jgi:hypothetical protein
MLRAAAEAADDAAEAPATGQKPWTTTALDAEARALAERRKLARDAARWAFEQKKGSKAACKHFYVEHNIDAKTLTYNMVQPLLKQLKAGGKIEDDRDHHNQILTDNERRKLANWILACADGQKPKNRVEISLRERRSAWPQRRRRRRGWRPSSALPHLSSVSLCAHAASCRARGPVGSGVPHAGLRAAYAR